jgi:hypothetical protein
VFFIYILRTWYTCVDGFSVGAPATSNLMTFGQSACPCSDSFQCGFRCNPDQVHIYLGNGFSFSTYYLLHLSTIFVVGQSVTLCSSQSNTVPNPLPAASTCAKVDITSGSITSTYAYGTMLLMDTCLDSEHSLLFFFLPPSTPSQVHVHVCGPTTACGRPAHFQWRNGYWHFERRVGHRFCRILC